MNTGYLIKFLGNHLEYAIGKVKTLLWRQKLCTAIGTILVAMFLLSYVELTLGTLTVLKTYIRADYNSTTTGEIIKSEMWHVDRPKISHDRYAYNIRYSYEVKGIVYEGKFVRLDNHSESEISMAQKTVSTYPVGKIVTVHYDSQSPKYSVLENTGLGIEVPGRLLFIFLVSPVVGWYLCKWSRGSRPKS